MVKVLLNKLANQYLVLGLGVSLSAIAALLALRVNPDRLLQNNKATMILLMGQLVAGIAAIAAGVTRKLKVIEVLAQAEPLCAETKPGLGGARSQNCSYYVRDVIALLMAGSGPVHPSEVFSDRLLHSFFPEVLSCSPVLHNYARKHFLHALVATTTFCLFVLMIFSAFLGIYANHENASVRWAALIYFYFLGVYGAFNVKTLSRKGIAGLIGGAIFFRSFFLSFFRQGCLRQRTESSSFLRSASHFPRFNLPFFPYY